MDKRRRTDKVIPLRQLEGMKQAYLILKESTDVEKEIEIDKELVYWRMEVRKGGD